jgi:hypothetical protein
VDIRVITPDGARQIRERKHAPVSSRTAAERWAEGRERVLFQRLMTPPQETKPLKEVPTLREFAPRFVEGHARANRQKPSGIAAKELIIRVHLVPALGSLLKKAVEWEVIDRMPCSIKLLPVPKPSTSFYDFDDYERLVTASKSTDVSAAERQTPKCRFANARPEPDFMYLSNAIARASHSSSKSSVHGRPAWQSRRRLEAFREIIVQGY